MRNEYFELRLPLQRVAGVQLAFLDDLREAAANRLKTTKFGEGLDPVDPGNPWGVDRGVGRTMVLPPALIEARAADSGATDSSHIAAVTAGV